MRVTFLGHQGWMFELDRKCILIDPLLHDSMGHPGGRKLVYPPRILDLDQFPPVDAVILSHEHEDHFDIPTLNCLDRRIPIFFPRRSSYALQTLVAEMGFEVQAVDPGDALRFGDLEVFFISPDHVKRPTADEWDVLPHLVRDVGGSGSLFSSVDVDLGPSDFGPIHDRSPQIGMWVLTNNVGNLGFQHGESHAPWDAGLLAFSWLSRFSELEKLGFDVSAFVTAGGGYSFAGDLPELDRVVFSANSEHVFAALSMLVSRRLIHTQPGDTFLLEQGNVVSVEHGRPFVSAAPRETWPRHEYDPVVAASDYNSATGNNSVSEKDLEELERELSNLARYSYGGDIFNALARLSPRQLTGRRAEFLLSLRTQAANACFVYRPLRCDFERRQVENPRRDYVLGMECWASDLLAFLRAEVSQAAITFGRMRSWNPLKLPVNVGFWLWMYGHPLQRPDRYLAFYRSILKQQPKDSVRIRRAEGVGDARR